MLFGIISVVVTLILVATQKYLSRKRKMSGVVLLLIGTGRLASIIYNSAINDLVVAAIEYMGLPGFILAPLSGVLLGAATASPMIIYAKIH